MKPNIKTPRILIVEDDEVYRLRLGRAFELRGYDVELAENYQDFKVLTQSGKFSYAVIDLRVAEFSGLEILRELKSIQPECRAVVLTGYGTIASSVSAIKLGAVNFLTKPTDPDSILQALWGDEPVRTPENMPLPTLAQQEWEHIQRVLDDCDGNITTAARILGLHRRSLQRKLAKSPNQLN